jgi:hypothetical protein
MEPPTSSSWMGLATPAPDGVSQTYETFKLLPPAPEYYTPRDFELLEEVLVMATNDWTAEQAAAGHAATSQAMGSLHVIKAYETVLSTRGISSSEDTYYYRLILKWSLDGRGNWFEKLEQEKRANSVIMAQGIGAGASAQAARTGSPAMAAVGPASANRAERGAASPNGFSRLHYASPDSGRHADDLGLAAVVNGRSPRSDASLGIINDISDWVDAEQREWRLHGGSPLSREASPAITPTLYPSPTAEESRATMELTRQLNSSILDRSSSSRERTALALNSPAQIFPEFHAMADAFRTWQRSIDRMRTVRLDHARAAQRYVDVLDYWQDRLCRVSFSAWHACVTWRKRATLHWAQKCWVECLLHWKMVVRDAKVSHRSPLSPAVTWAVQIARKSHRGWWHAGHATPSDETHVYTGRTHVAPRWAQDWAWRDGAVGDGRLLRRVCSHRSTQTDESSLVPPCSAPAQAVVLSQDLDCLDRAHH